jgi:O-antigen ligase
MRVNFGETHNDHLQVLAESGLPGYLILLAGLVYVARISFRRKREETDLRGRIASTLALPLVCGLAANMLAGFPLQLAAPAYTYAILGAACIAWRVDDDPA